MSNTADRQQPRNVARTKKMCGTVLDTIFKEFDVNIDVNMDHDEDEQGEYSDLDDEVLMNMDNLHDDGITLQ